MPTTITLPDIMELQLGRNGAIGSMTLVTTKIPQEAWDHWAKVYVRQWFTDAANAGGKDSPMAERLEYAIKKRDSLYAGELRTRSGGGEAEPADPFEAECYRLAIADLNATFRAAGKFKGLPKGTKDQLMFVINAERAKAGKAEITRAEAVDAYLTTKKGADIKKVAAQNLKRREAGDDELLASIGL